MTTSGGLGWPGIVRLGLAQSALGAIVVLMTSTINRVMVVELALPALVPGLLVAAHYAVQIFRPAWGHGSDVGGGRTPWILGGMATLALGAVGAAAGTALAADSRLLGLAVATAAFLLVGMGAGAAGTSVLALLASRVAPGRRAAAASLVWMMMILGFAVSAPLAGHFLDPFSNARLIEVTAAVSAAAFALAALAVWGVEAAGPANVSAPSRDGASFAAALREIWREPAVRRFTVFIVVSMLAYGAQELLIEPFAGLVFGMTPGATTKLAGLQHGGVLTGMIGVAVLATAVGGPALGSLRMWTIVGCAASAASLAGVAASGLLGRGPDAFRATVFALGLSNGVYAVAAIGSMMGLAGAGARAREGIRMGVWGAAQAIAYGAGGLAATGFADLGRSLGATPIVAYGLVFGLEAGLFLVATALARSGAPRLARPAVAPAGGPALTAQT